MWFVCVLHNLLAWSQMTNRGSEQCSIFSTWRTTPVSSGAPGRDHVEWGRMRLRDLPWGLCRCPCEERCEWKWKKGLFCKDFLHLQSHPGFHCHVRFLYDVIFDCCYAVVQYVDHWSYIDHHMLFFHWVHLYCSLTHQPEGIFTVLLFGALGEDGRWPPFAVVRTHGCYSSNKIELCKWRDLNKPSSWGNNKYQSLSINIINVLCYINIVEWFLHTLQKLQNTVARRVGELKSKSVTHQNGTTSILSQTGPSRCRFWLLCLVEQQQYIDMNNTHQIWWNRTRFVEITSLQKGICRGNRGYVRVSRYVNFFHSDT